MQTVINTVRGTALGVAEYLTPVLKVSTYVYYKHKHTHIYIYIYQTGHRE